MVALNSSDVKFNITSSDGAGNNSSVHELNSIEVGDKTYSDFVAPDKVTYDVKDVQGEGHEAKLFIGAEGGLQSSLWPADGARNDGFEQESLDKAFQSNDLNAYVDALNLSFKGEQSYTLGYDTPVTVTEDGFIFITEKNGNNSQTVQFLDENGEVLGEAVAVDRFKEDGNYMDLGVRTWSEQNIFASVFRLTDIEGLEEGMEIHSVKVILDVTPYGNNPKSGDGGDGKVFFFGDKGQMQPENNPPDALNDVFTGDFGEDIEGNVLDNDSDPDGDDLTVISNTDPSNGSVVMNEDGTFTYTPDADFSGEDQFTYTISDGNGGTDTAKVYITIKDEPPVDPNLPPDAVDDDFTGDFQKAIEGTVLDNDSDPDGDDLSVIDNTQPSNGSVVINGAGQFIYVPNEGFTGEDSFTYTISDGNGGTDSATVTLLIGDAPNNPPDAENDFFTGEFGETIEGTVLDNDSDPDGDDLTVISNTPASNGTVEMNEDGTFTYTPEDGFTGEDNFTYTITDGNGGEDTATVSLFVQPDPKDCDPKNLPPVAEDDFFETDFGKPVSGNILVNDSDPDGDPISIVVTGQPDNGTVEVNEDGTFTYTPNEGFSGTDTFVYVITDGEGGYDDATVTITVGEEDCPPKNAPPIAVKDSFLAEFDTEFTGNVLDNDSDPDGDPISVLINTQPQNGNVVMQPDGTFTYTPETGFFGDDTFEYVVTDGRGGFDNTTVCITVPCLAAGTLVTTSEGLKPVEDISVGDKVLTRDDGFQDVRWAGSRVLDEGELARNPDFVSVMIRAGALGNNLPRRDLRVSPGHRMLVSGAHAELMFGERDVLIAASDLVGQPGISFDARPVTYVHIMFDTHQIIDSEGAWSESFQPADVTLNGLDDEQRDELLALFPELASRKGQRGYAAARRVLAQHESRALLGV